MLHKTGFDNLVTVSRRGTQVITCFLPCKPGPASSFSPSAVEPDSLKLNYYHHSVSHVLQSTQAMDRKGKTFMKVI